MEWLLWSDGTKGKLERLPLMQETGSPKVLLYESANDGMLDYDEIKKRRVNVFTGVGCGVSTQKVEELMEIWNVVRNSCAPDQRDRSCLAILLKVDNLKSRSALDVVRPKLPKKTPTAVVTLDADQPDLLSRIRRGHSKHLRCTRGGSFDLGEPERLLDRRIDNAVLESRGHLFQQVASSLDSDRCTENVPDKRVRPDVQRRPVHRQA